MIVIETDLDLETAKKKFLLQVNVCDVNPKDRYPESLMKTAARGNIEGNEIWFDSTVYKTNNSFVNAGGREFYGTIEEGNGKTVVRGKFCGNMFLHVFIIFMAVILVIIDVVTYLKSGQRATLADLILSIIKISGICAIFLVSLNSFSKKSKKDGLIKLGQILEATRIYYTK